jgi:predicted DNA-binding transcriptional regulator AlpA
MHDEFETPEEVSLRLRKPESWLAKARVTGIGPKFVKIGGAIRYRRSDVDAWLAGLEHMSTASYRRRDDRPLAA